MRLVHGARRRRTEGACLSLPLALEWRVLAAMTRHLQAGGLRLQRSNHACRAPTGRASLRVVHGARWRRTEGACSSLPLALRPIRHLQCCLFPKSLRSAPRCEAEADPQGACWSLPLALEWKSCSAAMTRHLQVACVCNGAAMHVEHRLVEQACGCCTV